MPACIGACPSSEGSCSMARSFHTSPRAVISSLERICACPACSPVSRQQREEAETGEAGVHVGEAYAAGGEAVDVGRFGFGLSVTAEVAVSGIVHQDEDDVGTFLPTFFLCRGCRFGQGRCGCHGAEGGQQGVVFSFHVQERLVADKNRKIPGQNETCVRKRVCAGPICVPCTVIEMPVSRRRASDEPRGAPSEKSASGSCPPVCCGTL